MDGNNDWDFDCPQFVDFTGPIVLADDDQVEKYFDFDHENGVPVHLENEATPKRVATESVNAAETPDTRVTRSAKGKTPAKAEEKPQPSKTPRSIRSKSTGFLTPENDVTESPSAQRVTRSATVKTPVINGAEKKAKINNICTNMEEWNRKTAHAKRINGQTGKEPEAGKKNAEPDQAKREAAVQNNNKRQHRSLERSESMAKKMKPSVPERGRTPNKSTGLQRSISFSTRTNNPGPHCRSRSGATNLGQHDRSNSGARASPASTRKATADKNNVVMTVPTTPTFMKRKPIKMIHQEPLKTTEQRELDTIAFYKKELARKRKEAQESHKVAMSSKGPTQVPSTRELTRAEEFKFQTDSRIKKHNMETRSDSGGKNFEQILRSNKDQKQPSSTTKSGPTVPEPFNLTAQRKRKLPDMDEKQAQKYESMAQRIKAFTATPERFKSKPKMEPKRGRSRSPPHAPTIPKTPQFESNKRLRPVSAPTREQMEEKEYDEAKKHQFKAHPVNQRILENPSCGVKKVPTKPLTAFDEFHLSGQAKKMDRQQENRDEHYEFHAQPLNKKILEGPVGVKSPRRLPVTMPASPAFALKNRVRMPQEPESKEKPVLRSRKPHSGIPFLPQLGHKTTQPRPFGFDERDKRKAEEKIRHIEQVIEDENRQREFHANPLPDNLSPHLPQKRVKPLTVKQPFNLESDKRGRKKAEEWSNKLEEEVRYQKEMARFKANEPVVLEKQPFVPKKDCKFTTEFTEFELNTAKRIAEREVFETHLKSKQDELDSVRRQERLMKEAEEAEEFERQRRNAVHKANPIKHYKRVALKPSEKPLTAPMSPMFKTDERLRTRSNHSGSNLSL